MNYEVELVAFCQRLRQRKMDRRLDCIGERSNDFQLRSRSAFRPKAAAILIAAPIEDEDLIARLQAEHVNEMVRLLFRKGDERASDVGWWRVESATRHVLKPFGPLGDVMRDS